MTIQDETLAGLRARAEDADGLVDWPEKSWHALQQAGVLRWAIGREFGGDGLAHTEILAGNEQLGGACLTTAFILSQREAAVRSLNACRNSSVRNRYLPPLARGEAFLTVGLSQLTTSRRPGVRLLRAEPFDDGKYRLDGEIPWVSGADQADAIVIGATLPDDRQVLLALPTDHPGVAVEPPMPLAALSGSRTSSVRCSNVVFDSKLIMAGPEERVLGKGFGGGLDTSCLALALAGAAIDHLHQEALARPDLQPLVEQFEGVRQRNRQRLHALAISNPEIDEVLNLRAACTTLVLRATQTALAVSKGTGFVSPHPAERWAKQALFFLVWSCPQPAVKAIIADLMKFD